MIISASSKKDSGDQLQKARDNNFAQTWGAYGKEWARTYKNNDLARPSLAEVMGGLLVWYQNQTIANSKNKS